MPRGRVTVRRRPRDAEFLDFVRRVALAPAVRKAAVPILVLLVACVGPARHFETFESKAAKTASDAVSSVDSALLAVELAEERKAIAPYITTAIEDAEDDVTAVQGSFDSIQPPDPESDRLREELDGLLSDAVSGVSALRIAARRGNLDSLPKIARPLSRVSDELERFYEENA